MVNVTKLCLLATAWAGAVLASNTVTDGVRTIAGELVTVAAESDLDGDGQTAGNVVLTEGGGIAFTQSLMGGANSLKKTYTLDGTGVVSVAAGQTVEADGARFVAGAVGHTLVKRGPGTFYTGKVGTPAAARTRFIVEEGMFQCRDGDFWGGHATANTNVTLDVREGAVYHHGGGHGVVGPVELTGGTFKSTSGAVGQWADAAFCGGITAHAAATPSRVLVGYKGFVGHYIYTNGLVTVDAGATLILDGTLRDGWNASASKRVPCRIVKRGAGALYLLKPGEWTGGTVLEGGSVTVGATDAFGTGPVTVAGDVTLTVALGAHLDLSDLRVQGVHTLTLAGEGSATLPEPLPAGLTVANSTSGSPAEPIVDGRLVLNGGTVAVNVPAGETVSVTGTSSAPLFAGLDTSRTRVVKTGDGTLELPAGINAAYGELEIRQGFVSVTDESSFGSGVTTVADGAGLRILTSFSQGRAAITFDGTATLDIPTGVTLGYNPSFFKCSGKTLVKTGGGLWRMDAPFPSLAAGTRWIVHEGTLRAFKGDAFSSYNVKPALVLEIHEGAAFETVHANAHLPIGDVTLRGGTLRAGYGQFTGDHVPLEGGTPWKGFGLNGTVTVLPSNDGRPARLEARACHAGHNNAATGTPFETTFDVRAGATFEVDAMICPGRQPADSPFTSGLVKEGKGTLRFLRPLALAGVLDVRNGTAEFGPGVTIGEQATVRVAPAARLVLDDTARLTAKLDTVSALCASAELWLDAARIRMPDGARIEAVPNLGTLGGTFARATEGHDGIYAAAPTFVARGINGLGSLAFNGTNALTTAAYTNTGAAVSVFLVSRWTSWEGVGNKGRWGGPLSLSARNPTSFGSGEKDDNQIHGGLSYQHGNETTLDYLKTYGGQDLTVSGVGFEIGKPYLTYSWRDADLQKASTALWMPDATQCVTGNIIQATGGIAYNCQINRVCVGGRLRNGAPQVFSSWNRMYFGEIGEVLVFSRRLSDAERDAINAYLHNKWFGTAEPLPEGSPMVGAMRISVPADARADLVLDGAQADGTAHGIVKEGAGTLRYGGAATGGLALDVREGALALASGRLASRVDVWVDAADAAARTLDADGRVTNLVNKGSAGGAFRLSARADAGVVPPGPALKEDGLNGRAVLAFDGNACLALESYTNRVAPRAINIYLVARRTAWATTPEAATEGGFGKWSGPFALARVTADKSDEALSGAFHVSEDATKTGRIDLGNTEISLAMPPTGEPYLFVLHSLTNGYLAAYETNATDVARVPRWAKGQDYHAEPCDIDLVHLGSRIREDGRPQWYGKGNGGNRCWFGDIGEFIVTTQPLTDDEEADLFAYLRAKWLDKGDGAATPPDWLAGTPATPVTDAATALAMADGTRLEHAAAPLALGALETAGTVDWTRTWSGGSAADFPLFTVAGDAALGTIRFTPRPLPKGEAKVLDWTGDLLGVPAWRMDGVGGATISRRGKALWLIRAGTILTLR